MSADNYPSIFSRQMEAIVYLYHTREIASTRLPSSCSNYITKRNQQNLAIFVDDF